MARLIPTVAGILSAIGAGTLIWYYSKSTSEREALDEQVSELAQDWLDKNAGLVTATALRGVYDEAKKLS